MKKRYTEEQIIKAIKQHEARLQIYVVNWVYLQELLKRTGTFAGLEVNEAKRLRELDSENNKRKRLLAEKLSEVVAVILLFVSA